MSRAPPNTPQNESVWQRLDLNSLADDDVPFPSSLYNSAPVDPVPRFPDPTLELLAANDVASYFEDVPPNSIERGTTIDNRSTVHPVGVFTPETRNAQLQEFQQLLGDNYSQFQQLFNEYRSQREPAPANVSVFVGNSDPYTQRPTHEESPGPSSPDDVFRYGFPPAADVIKKILSDSNLQTYRLEERFVLLLTFCVTKGILCQAGDFVFPQLFIDMIKLWNDYEPDGFRVIISSLQNNTLPPPSSPPPRDEQKINDGISEQKSREEEPLIEAELIEPGQTSVSDAEAADDQPSPPTTQEYPGREDVFAGLSGIEVEAATDLAVAPRPRQAQALQNHEEAIQNNIATSSRQDEEEKKEEIAIAEAFDDPREQQSESLQSSESLQPGHQQLVNQVGAQLRHHRGEVNSMRRTYEELQDDFVNGPRTPVRGDEESHTAYVSQQLEATPATRSRRRSAVVPIQNIVVSDEDDGESTDEPVLPATRRDTRRPPPRSSSSSSNGRSSPPLSVIGEILDVPPEAAEADGPERIGGRQRAYNPLRVDDESAWAQRARQRASYWTKRLAVMKEQGIITNDDWDGTPITPDQWNNRRGSSVLRDLFKRDRLVEYQAYRRDIQRQMNERDGTQIRDDLVPPPFDKKGRKGRGGKKRNNPVAVKNAKKGNYKKGDTRLDDVIDFGKSAPAASARQILDRMNLAKLTRKGRGLLEKHYHVFMVSPKSVAWVNNDSGSAHYLSTMTARIALMTLLFLANPKHGDALREGLAELVYQLGFEDIFNLFRFQPQFIPKKYADLFTGKDVVQGGLRWNKTGRPRRFASFVDQWTKKAAENPDELKITVLILNSLIQLQLIDNLHASVEMGGRVKTAPPAYNEDGINGTVALVSNLGIDLEDILTLQKDIKASFRENIDYFMSHAAHRLYARQDS